jgi:hypothetical protein
MASGQVDLSPDAAASQASNGKQPFVSDPSNSTSSKTELGGDFQPSAYSVICGRGKHSSSNVGNRRLRILAGSFTDEYSQANRKATKLAVVSGVVALIRNVGGHFCKYEKGAWFEVGDPIAREKVGALLRDLLHTQYRFSSQAKIARGTVRKQEQIQQWDQQQPVSGTGHSDDGHSGDEHSNGVPSDSVPSDDKHLDGVLSEGVPSDGVPSDDGHSDGGHSNDGHSDDGHSDDGHSNDKHSDDGHSDDEDSDDSSMSSSCWGGSNDYLGLESSLEDDFFDINVF